MVFKLKMSSIQNTSIHHLCQCSVHSSSFTNRKMSLIINLLEYQFKKLRILIGPLNGLIFLLIIQLWTFDLASATEEHFEFEVKNPMILLSFRNFAPSSSDSESLYISKGKNGSVLLKADPGYGIMAVVQQMNLQDVHSNEYETNCFDFMKISEKNGTKNTGELCGHSDNAHFVQQLSFVDKSGYTELTYRLNDKIRVSPFEGNYTNFNVSFTPFTECPEDAFPFGNGVLRPCSALDSFSCIPVEYFCDGVINCAFPDEFGTDELYCSKGKEKLFINELQPSVDKDEEVDEDEFLSGRDMYPYDPYIYTQGEEDEEKAFVIPRVLNETYTIRTRTVYLNGGNALGLCVIIALFMTLVSLSRVKAFANKSESRTLSDGKFDATSSTNLISNDDYDIQADPAPPYELCIASHSLLAHDYTLVSYENECPPSYDEVKVHSLIICHSPSEKTTSPRKE